MSSTSTNLPLTTPETTSIVNDSVCSVESVVPEIATYCYGGVQATLLLLLIIKSYTMTDKKLKPRKRIRKTLVLAWQKKRCFFPVLAHIFDQMTDFGVIIEFYQIWQKTDKDNYCAGVNIFVLFVLSVLAFCVYRIYSAFQVGLRLQSWKDGLLQFFDLKLFHAVWINYQSKSDAPSNPQKWIQSMEATFEAFPQAVIQLYFLLILSYHGNVAVSGLLIVSLLWSVWSVASKAISEDKWGFKEYAKTLCSRPREKHREHDHGCMFGKNDKYYISYSYLARVFLRFNDVFTRLGLLAVMWGVMGGYILTIYLVLEASCLVAVGLYYKELSNPCTNLFRFCLCCFLLFFFGVFVVVPFFFASWYNRCTYIFFSFVV